MDRRHRLWAGMLVEAGFGTNASVVETPDGDGADAEGPAHSTPGPERLQGSNVT